MGSRIKAMIGIEVSMGMEVRMKGMDKKGFAKTLEAIIAVVLSFLFIVFFIPPVKTDTDFVRPDLSLIDILEQNPSFRNCVVSENYTCINSTLMSYYPYFAELYAYTINISTDPEISGVELPQADVHIESLMIAGNDTFLYPKTLRVYYWDKT
jgi:hypothetical protein